VALSATKRYYGTTRKAQDRYPPRLQIKYPVSLKVLILRLRHKEPLMQIIAQCPRCGSAWLLDSSGADRRMRCGKCRRLFKVPKLEDVPKAIKVIRQAKGTIYVDEAGKTYG
jgi:ribosomal protein S27AE